MEMRKDGGLGRVVVMVTGTGQSHQDQDGVAEARGDEPRGCLPVTCPLARAAWAPEQPAACPRWNAKPGLGPRLLCSKAQGSPTAP